MNEQDVIDLLFFLAYKGTREERIEIWNLLRYGDDSDIFIYVDNMINNAKRHSQ